MSDVSDINQPSNIDEWRESDRRLREERAKVREVLGARSDESVVDAARRVADSHARMFEQSITLAAKVSRLSDDRRVRSIRMLGTLREILGLAPGNEPYGAEDGRDVVEAARSLINERDAALAQAAAANATMEATSRRETQETIAQCKSVSPSELRRIR